MGFFISVDVMNLFSVSFIFIIYYVSTICLMLLFSLLK